jgi:hypothetical protein
MTVRPVSIWPGPAGGRVGPLFTLGPAEFVVGVSGSTSDPPRSFLCLSSSLFLFKSRVV